MTFPLAAAVIAVLACLIVGRSAGFLVRRMRPAQAVPLVTAASLAVSLASGLALTAIAVAVGARLSSVAAAGHWSAAIIKTEVPMPGWLGAVAALAVVVLLLRAAVRTAVIVAALVRADRLCRNMRAGGGPIVIVDDESVDAYTVAGLRGCVVISRRLFAALSSDERRVLTAHELSHLNKRHHLFVHLADIASAANPLLKPASAAVRLGVERWADEDAAISIGDRRVAGRALARVALLRSSLAASTIGRVSIPVSATAVPVLAVAAQQVACRVQALLAPSPRRQTGRLAVTVGLALAVLALGLVSLDDIHQAIEIAAPVAND